MHHRSIATTVLCAALLVSSLAVSGCGPIRALDPALSPRSATPVATPTSSAPSAPTTAPAPVAGDWVDGDLTFDAGALVPTSFDSLVHTSLTGREGWKIEASSTGAELAFKQESTGCVVSHGVYQDTVRTDVSDHDASVAFLSLYAGDDVSGVDLEVIGVPRLWVSTLYASPEELAAAPTVDMLALMAYTENKATLLMGRSVARIGKSFIMTVTCATAEQNRAVFTEIYGTIAFGLSDPADGF